MPVTDSAKKSLRRDRRRAEVNLKIRGKVRKALKEARKNTSKKTLIEAYSVLDRAAKKKVIHRRRSARLKSRLARQIKTAAKLTKAKTKSTKTQAG